MLGIGIASGFAALWVPGMGILAAGIFALINALADKEKVRFNYFAQDNNLTFSALRASDSHYDHNPRTDPTSLIATKSIEKSIIGQTGRSKQQLNIICGDSIASYTYQYTTGSGKNRRTHNWKVCMAKLSRELPHILLDSKANNFTVPGTRLGISNIAGGVRGSQKIDAGILSEHYDVYVPDSYDVDVLSVIGPDIVEKLLQFAKDYDIEIIDGYVYAYRSGQLKLKDTPTMFELAEMLQDEFNDNLRNYRDQRVTTISQREGISEKGLRLKKSRLPLIFGIWVFAIYMIVRLFAAQPSRLVLYAVTSVICAVLVALYVRYRER